MDSGKGKFVYADSEEESKENLEQYPDHGGVFYEGEKIKLRGSHFVIQSIKPKRLILKLLDKGRMR